MENYKKIIKDIYFDVKKVNDIGKVASYIPELANVNENNFGVHINTIHNEGFGVGDFNKKFSIQSVSKILTLTLAYKLEDERIWDRVDVEPSGNPFNSLLQLEADLGKPRNPFINAGAIVVCDILISKLNNPKKDFLAFCRDIANNKNLNYSEKVAKSEKETGFRNIALCNFIKSFGNIKNDVEEVLDFYFYTCSLEMSCKELSEIFLFLADDTYKNHKDESLIKMLTNYYGEVW